MTSSISNDRRKKERKKFNLKMKGMVAAMVQQTNLKYKYTGEIMNVSKQNKKANSSLFTLISLKSQGRKL